MFELGLNYFESMALSGVMAKALGDKFADGVTGYMINDLIGSTIRDPGTGDFSSESLDIIGKVWGLPDAVLGIVYGGIGHVIGEVGQALRLLSAEPTISFNNNAIQFENNPLMMFAMTFGNAIVYGTHYSMNPEYPRYGGTHTLGFEEMQHTYQSQVLGPLYFPLHIVSGITGLIRNESWHGSPAFLESGPHHSKPNPW